MTSPTGTRRFRKKTRAARRCSFRFRSLPSRRHASTSAAIEKEQRGACDRSTDRRAAQRDPLVPSLFCRLSSSFSSSRQKDRRRRRHRHQGGHRRLPHPAVRRSALPERKPDSVFVPLEVDGQSDPWDSEVELSKLEKFPDCDSSDREPWRQAASPRGGGRRDRQSQIISASPLHRPRRGRCCACPRACKPPDLPTST